MSAIRDGKAYECNLSINLKEVVLSEAVKDRTVKDNTTSSTFNGCFLQCIKWKIN